MEGASLISSISCAELPLIYRSIQRGVTLYVVYVVTNMLFPTQSTQSTTNYGKLQNLKAGRDTPGTEVQLVQSSVWPSYYYWRHSQLWLSQVPSDPFHRLVVDVEQASVETQAKNNY
jgi:hypothetical protein